MRGANDAFVRAMYERTNFEEQATITFSDGRSVSLGPEDFTLANNRFSSGAGESGLPIGVAVSRSIQLEVVNDDDRFATYDFMGASISLHAYFQLARSRPAVWFGTFYVVEPESYGSVITITAVDAMYKTEKPFETDLTGMNTLRSLMLEVCDKCGLSLDNENFNNSGGYIDIDAVPRDITFRELIGYVAMLSRGGNAYINEYSRLCIRSYKNPKWGDDDFAYIDAINDGGGFRPWDTGAELDGGSFDPWNEGDVEEGENFADDFRDKFAFLFKWSSFKAATDYVQVTGFRTKDSEGNVVLSQGATEGYILDIDNPLLECFRYTTNLSKIMYDYIAAWWPDIYIRPFEGEHTANPLIEFMDPAIIFDRFGNMYKTFLTDVDFAFNGYTRVQNSAVPAVRKPREPVPDEPASLTGSLLGQMPDGDDSGAEEPAEEEPETEEQPGEEEEQNGDTE